MNSEQSLERFITAQEKIYAVALQEIMHGRKQSHWMWFIFPQLKGLGRSDTAKFYGIRDSNEAMQYLRNPVLGKRLIEISTALLGIEGRTAHEIFGSPDDLKLFSCMTLFASLPGTDPVFGKVLEKYFGSSHTASS